MGHSTIIVAAAAAAAFVATSLLNASERYKEVGGLISTSVSAAFLILIGLANLVVLVGVWRTFRQVRRTGRFVEEDLDMLLANQGVLARVLRPLFRLVTRSWHMYPLGFLFALGFDTATEVSLFGLSASQASNGTDLWVVLVFPALFTAGMALVDATDGVLMLGAYSWAYVQPMRKLFYNLTITLASVAVALVIGTLEALDLIADKLALQGSFWVWVGAVNDSFGVLGFGIVGLFAAAWLGSWLAYRLGGFDRIAVGPADPADTTICANSAGSCCSALNAFRCGLLRSCGFGWKQGARNHLRPWWVPTSRLPIAPVWEPGARCRHSRRTQLSTYWEARCATVRG